MKDTDKSVKDNNNLVLSPKLRQPAKVQSRINKRRPTVSKYNTGKVIQLFKGYYSITGNATTAMMRVNPKLSKHSAYVYGCKMLNRLSMGEILDNHGLNGDLIVDKLAEGLSSTKPVVYGDNVEYTPDYHVRHKYIETTLRLRGYGINNSTININNDNRRLVVSLPNEVVDKS